jgi:hypothetical protein
MKTEHVPGFEPTEGIESITTDRTTVMKTELTDEQLRVKVAGFCPHLTKIECQCGNPECPGATRIPELTLDLMHEAEQLLLRTSQMGDLHSDFLRYVGHLGRICGPWNTLTGEAVTVAEHFARTINATATERALAFVMTMEGKS